MIRSLFYFIFLLTSSSKSMNGASNVDAGVSGVSGVSGVVNVMGNSLIDMSNDLVRNKRSVQDLSGVGTEGGLSYQIETDYLLTGTGYSDENSFNISLRFSSAFDKNFYVFTQETDSNKTNIDNLITCFNTCDHYDYCNGVFYRIRNKGSECVGLSYLGKMVSTRVRSLSYTKTRNHLIYDPSHTIRGYIRNNGEVNYNSTVFLDMNLDGELDDDELSVHTDYDGYYEFTNLTFGSYPIQQQIMYPEECEQMEPGDNGTLDGYNHMYNDGYPDLIINYFDSVRGGLDGLNLGKPHGGSIKWLLEQDGIPMSDKLVPIDISTVLGENTEYTLILSENSYITLGFTHDIIYNDNDNVLTVRLLSEINDVDFLYVNVSQDNVNWEYLGMITSENTSLPLSHVSAPVIRAVRLIGASSIGLTRGVPFVSLYVGHSSIDEYPYGYIVHLHNTSKMYNFTNYCMHNPINPSTYSYTSTTAITTTSSTIKTNVSGDDSGDGGDGYGSFTTKSSSDNDSSTFFTDTNVILISVFSSLGFVLLVGGIVVLTYYCQNKTGRTKRLESSRNDAGNENDAGNTEDEFENNVMSFDNPLFSKPPPLTTEFQSGEDTLMESSHI